MVYVTRLFKSGDITDLFISLQTVKPLLRSGQSVEAAPGYLHDHCVHPPISTCVFKHFHNWAPSRHKKVNSYFKNFTVLSTSFHHNLEFHSDLFFPVSWIVPAFIKVINLSKVFNSLPEHVGITIKMSMIISPILTAGVFLRYHFSRRLFQQLVINS